MEYVAGMNMQQEEQLQEQLRQLQQQQLLQKQQQILQKRQQIHQEQQQILQKRQQIHQEQQQILQKRQQILQQQQLLQKQLQQLQQQQLLQKQQQNLLLGQQQQALLVQQEQALLVQQEQLRQQQLSQEHRLMYPIRLIPDIVSDPATLDEYLLLGLFISIYDKFVTLTSDKKRDFVRKVRRVADNFKTVPEVNVKVEECNVLVPYLTDSTTIQNEKGRYVKEEKEDTYDD